MSGHTCGLQVANNINQPVDVTSTVAHSTNDTNDLSKTSGFEPQSVNKATPSPNGKKIKRKKKTPKPNKVVTRRVFTKHNPSDRSFRPIIRRVRGQPTAHTNNPVSAPIIVVDCTTDRAETRVAEYSEAESDCEIIETPVETVSLLDDVTNDPILHTKSNEPNSIDTTVGATVVNNEETCKSVESESIQENSIEIGAVQEPPDSEPLFFVDKNPGTSFEAPIYEIIPNAPINGNMSLKPTNIRVTIPNGKRPTLDHSFKPNPLLSSTRVDQLNESTETSIDTSSSKNDSTPATNFHISIDSTVGGDTVRRVNSGPSTSNHTIVSGDVIGSDNQENMDDSGNNNEKVDNCNKTPEPNTSRPKKRKATEKENREEPPSKKHSSDVIVLDDTISDQEDSVIFVSEDVRKTNRNTKKAADFIPLGNSKRSPSSKNQSTRAKRRVERAQKKSKLPRSPQKTNKNEKKATPKSTRTGNRFAMKNPSTSFASPTASAADSNRAQKRKHQMDYEEEKKMFATNPELFEKRAVVIDGSNVAWTHGRKNNAFSIKGIELCLKYFEDRGFTAKAVVPQMRLKRSFSSDPDTLERLNRAGKVVITPCKNLPGQKSSSYDDRFILDLATHLDAAVISNDNYADLLNEREEWKKIITERVIGFTWCDDFFMLPQDPYGRTGQSLDLILHKLKATDITEDQMQK